MSATQRQSPRKAIQGWLEATCSDNTRMVKEGPYRTQVDSETHGKHQSGNLHKETVVETPQPLQGQDLNYNIPKRNPKEKASQSFGSNDLAKGLDLPFCYLQTKDLAQDLEIGYIPRRHKRKRSSSLITCLEPVPEVAIAKHELQCSTNKRRPKVKNNVSNSSHKALSPHDSESNASCAIATIQVERSYERKARHKTREDRYELKEKKPRTDLVKTTKDRRKKQKRKEKSGATLLHDFNAKNVASDRLTLKPAAQLGVFNKGRASSPFRRRGLPDLSFSELNFHNSRKAEPLQPSQKTARDRARRESRDVEADDEMSRFFASKTRPFRERDSNVFYQNSKLINDQQRSQPCRGKYKEDVDEEMLFLGNGEPGPNSRSSLDLGQTIRPSPAASTTYYTWSRSSQHLQSPRLRPTADQSGHWAHRDNQRKTQSLSSPLKSNQKSYSRRLSDTTGDQNVSKEATKIGVRTPISTGKQCRTSLDNVKIAKMHHDHNSHIGMGNKLSIIGEEPIGVIGRPLPRGIAVAPVLDHSNSALDKSAQNTNVAEEVIGQTVQKTLSSFSDAFNVLLQQLKSGVLVSDHTDELIYAEKVGTPRYSHCEDLIKDIVNDTTQKSPKLQNMIDQKQPSPTASRVQIAISATKGNLPISNEAQDQITLPSAIDEVRGHQASREGLSTSAIQQQPAAESPLHTKSPCNVRLSHEALEQKDTHDSSITSSLPTAAPSRSTSIHNAVGHPQPPSTMELDNESSSGLKSVPQLRDRIEDTFRRAALNDVSSYVPSLVSDGTWNGPGSIYEHQMAQEDIKIDNFSERDDGFLTDQTDWGNQPLQHPFGSADLQGIEGYEALAPKEPSLRPYSGLLLYKSHDDYFTRARDFLVPPLAVARNGGHRLQQSIDDSLQQEQPKYTSDRIMAIECRMLGSPTRERTHRDPSYALLRQACQSRRSGVITQGTDAWSDKTRGEDEDENKHPAGFWQPNRLY